MTVNKEVLVGILDEEFEKSDVKKVEDSDKIVIRRSMQPYQVRKEVADSLEQSVQTFLMYHTEEWVLDTTTQNSMEGYIDVTILKSDNVDNMQYGDTYDKSRW